MPLDPWKPEDVKQLFEQLVPAAEELTSRQISERAFKAKLPPDVLQEVCADAKWPVLAKKGVEISGPPVLAQLLNDVGIPAKYKHQTVLATSFASIGANHFKVLKRLDKLIALQEAQLKKANANIPAEPHKN